MRHELRKKLSYNEEHPNAYSDACLFTSDKMIGDNDIQLTSRRYMKSCVFDTDLSLDLNGDMLMSHQVVGYFALRSSLPAELGYLRILCSVFTAESTDSVPSIDERRWSYKKTISSDRKRQCSSLRTLRRRSCQYSHTMTCTIRSRQTSRLNLCSDISGPTKLCLTSKISSPYILLSTGISIQDFFKHLNDLIEWGVTMGSNFVEQSLALLRRVGESQVPAEIVSSTSPYRTSISLWVPKSCKYIVSQIGEFQLPMICGKESPTIFSPRRPTYIIKCRW